MDVIKILTLLRINGFWKRPSSSLEKAFLVVLGICATITSAAGSPYTIPRFRDDVCVTPECAVAGNIYYIFFVI